MIWSRDRQLAYELNRDVKTTEARITIGIMRPLLWNGTHTLESAGAIRSRNTDTPVEQCQRGMPVFFVTTNPRANRLLLTEIVIPLRRRLRLADESWFLHRTLWRCTNPQQPTIKHSAFQHRPRSEYIENRGWLTHSLLHEQGMGLRPLPEPRCRQQRSRAQAIAA